MRISDCRSDVCSSDLSKDQSVEDIGSIKVDGLNALNDELLNAIMGAESLGAAFKNVANQIIADLLRIAIRQAIIKPLAGALGLGFADGGEIPGFASGGMFAGPGGPRSDSLLARVSPDRKSTRLNSSH